MDLSKIVQLRLLRQDLPQFVYNEDFYFRPVTFETVDGYKNDIEKVVEYHYQDIEWRGTPDFDTVKLRVLSGSICHLFYYREECLGWHWTADNIMFDWINVHHVIPADTVYGGGAFISRKNKPSASTALHFWRQGLEYDLDYHGVDTMYLYVDSWNRASIQLCYKCGFKNFNFI